MRKTAQSILGWALLCVVHLAPADEGPLSDAERGLEAVRTKLVQRLDAPAQAHFETVQHAWARYRDAECDFQTRWTEGGSIRPTLLALCRDQLAGERERQLARYLECEEGDMTCPPPN